MSQLDVETQIRTNAAQTAVFVRLPDEPPAHRIVGELPDGTKIRAVDVESIWNIAASTDAIRGAGAYRAALQTMKNKTQDVNERQTAVYDLAVALYGRVPALMFVPRAGH